MRHAKQLIYGIFYLVFWAAIGSGIYYAFVRPAPTCYDRIQNQGEEGVDCGGVCSRQCIPELAPIRVSNVSVIPLVQSTSSVHVSLVGQVGNPNGGWDVAHFAYTFKVYDADGREMASFPGTSQVFGAEVKYVAMPNVEISGTALPQSATLTIEVPQWKKAGIMVKPELTATLVSTESNPTIVARGNVKNDGTLPANAELLALFFDEYGKVAGVSVTALERLRSHETRDFSIFHPSLPNIVPDRTRVFVSGYTVQ